MTLKIDFDRGTLRLRCDDAEDATTAATLPLVRWDARASCFRAPGHAYPSLRRAARTAALSFDDSIVQELAQLVSVEEPPLRPYQSQALASWDAAGRRGIVAMPTGSGKTRVAIAAIARVGLPALILVPTRVLLAQWEAELARWTRAPIGLIGDGALQVERITISTIESAYRRLDDYGDRFALLIVDEAHHFSTGLRREALEMSVAPFRLGLTATLPESERAQEALGDLLGPPVFQLELSELLGRDLAELEIVRLTVGLTARERERYDAAYAVFREAARVVAGALRRRGPDALVKELRKSASGRSALVALARAQAIASLPIEKQNLVATLLLRHEADRTLVFGATATDARTIAEKTLTPLITADVGRVERNEIIERFREGTYRAIVSARVLNEGFDVPDANVAIVAGSALGRREHLQRVGRILRPAPGKRARLYEIVTRGTLDERRSHQRSIRKGKERHAAVEPG